MYTYVKFEDNWADEMNIFGFKVMEQEEWLTLRSKIKAMAKFTIGVGSNQELNYKNGDEFLRSVTIRNMTDTEYDVFKSYFGSPYDGIRYGKDVFEQILDMIEDDE